jgi:UDP-N-acetylmuramate--alanine ligase
MASKSKKEPKSFYFIGINGVAMSGLAVMAKQAGYEVAGSDEAEDFPTDAVLEKNGIHVHKGFRAENLQSKPDVVVVSAAYGVNNVECKAAKSLRLTIQTQSEALGALMQKYEGIGIAGVHGKTTTSSLLAYILKEAGHAPSYMIGAPDVPGLSGNAYIGDGKYFVAEADEYRKSEASKEPKFLDLPLKHVIITSIELDHPDVYETAEDVYRAFYQLTIRLPRDGTIVACIDSPLVRRLVQRSVDRKCLTYGFGPQAEYAISNVSHTPTDTTFSLKTGEGSVGTFTMKLPGKHNILNATAAIIMAMKLGVSIKAISQALATFQGPARRFERLGEYNGAPVYHDYAHHPTALTYLIETAKEQFPNSRVVMVFQPHTYSRTGKLLKEFAASLAAADQLILLNIFASAREKSGYVTIKDLVDEVRKLKPDAEYRSSLEDAATYLASFVSTDHVVFLVGAGDVYKIFQKLREQHS